MLLTKFLKAEYAINDLGKSHLRVSKAHEFNDPFECLPRDDSFPDSFEEFKIEIIASVEFRDKFFRIFQKHMPSMTLEDFKTKCETDEASLKDLFNFWQEKQPNWFKSAREEISRSCYLLTSFSIHDFFDSKALLMWSHYADSHKGIAIKFDFGLFQNKNDPLQEITYEDDRAPFSLLEADIHSKYHNDRLVKSWTTKSKHWEYEKEFRWFVPIENCIDQFVKLDKQAFKEICFGLNCSEDDIQECLKIIKSEYPWVKAYRSKLHNKEFKLIPEEIDIHNYR